MSYRKYLTFVALLIGLPASLLQAHCHNHSSHDDSSADYVIVGVGTGGAVLAKKLSDDNKTSVIALHIGKNETENPLIKFSKNAPITVASGIIGPPFYENGETTKQPNADDRELLWVLALPEGGASSVNAGAYCRGTNELYSHWEAIAGPHWSVDNVLKIYKELEDYHGETNNPIFRGFHGPISVRQNPDPSNVSKKFNNAIIAATGFPFVLDYNDPTTPIGSSTQLQYTQSPNGKLRVSSATAFLNEDVMTPEGFGVGKRKLRVLFESTALRTIWKGDKAVGVEYLHNGKRRKVSAKKGVIVCAGLNSSAFLMHSGVGPAPLLKSLKIPVKFDNPNVGKGLADQPSVRMVFTSNPDDFVPPTTGLFSQISWLPAVHGLDPNKRELRIATINAVPGLTLFLLDLCQPKSRGVITINSADPLDPPVINLGEFTDPGNEDLRMFQQGLQVYVKNINEKLKKTDPLYQLVFPDPAILDDSAAVRSFIRKNVGCNQHFQSHCRMTQSIEEGGVVDPTGRVFGVRNLFVADDSVSPLCMDGSPMASAYLIAANIANMLIENDPQ